MWSFYVFMTWFLIITIWKNIIGAIFAKIWSVVTFFGHTAQKPKHPSQDEADRAHMSEHSQDEADSIHGENVHDHEDSKMLLSELSDIESLYIKICVRSSGWQFIFEDYTTYRTLEQTGDHTTYFAALDHISSLMTMKSLKIALEDGNESLRSMSEHRHKELSDYLEAFWKAVASNRSLENVDVNFARLYKGEFISRGAKLPYGVVIANWIAKVLVDNETISRLEVLFDGSFNVKAARILSSALLANQTLKTLQLKSLEFAAVNICGKGMGILLEPFSGKGDKCNSVLEHLSLDHIITDDNGVEQIAAMLMVNDSIKGFSFWRPWRPSRPYNQNQNGISKNQNGISKIGDALSVNRSLQKLEIYSTTIHPQEFEGLFKPLMQDDSGFQKNTCLKSFILLHCNLGHVGFEYLIAMIERNASLIELDMVGIDVFRDSIHYDCEENVCRLLDSLKGHPSIESLDFKYNSGVQGDKVLGTFMDLLLENNHIQAVDLRGTPIDSSGNAKKIYTELERRRQGNSWEIIKDMAKADANIQAVDLRGTPTDLSGNANKIYTDLERRQQGNSWEIIKDMAKADANLSGRIFLCGDGEAGKTTLCTTIKEIYEMEKQSKQGSSRSKIPPSLPKTKMDKKERTRGIEVHDLSYDDLDLTIWDMAGQEEYHSFHDLVIPNLSGAGSACTFILVCKLVDTLDGIKSKLQYWLQFIASNTRKSRSYRPRVIITMTHYDLCSHKDPLYYDCLEEEVKDLKEQFKDLLEFETKESFYAMDARESNGSATQMFGIMIAQIKGLLEKLPKVLMACFELQKRVKDWNIQHPIQPFLPWDKFSCICEQVEELKATPTNMELVERRRKFVALSLHDGGHIIYNEDIQVVIMNPHWFCHGVMGELLLQFHHYSNHHDLKVITRGLITSANFKRILSRLEIIGDENHAHTADFVKIMTKLQICYDQGDSTFMVPSTLPQREELLNWSISGDTPKTNYIGRRLALKDMKCTILSAGFFPRLQVYFRGKMKDDNTKKSYKLTKDTITFIENGKEVIIQYDGHIDVMVRSTQKKDILLDFLHEVFCVINELLGNPTLGCPGVVLVECVLRPLCVQKLTKKEHRRDQIVLLASLKGEVLKCNDLNYSHNWNDCEELAQGFDNARDLLGQGEWDDIVLERRRAALEESGTEVVSSLPSWSVLLDSKDHATSESERRDEAQANPTLSRIHSLKMRMVETKSSLESRFGKIEITLQEHDKKLDGINASVNESLQFSVELQKAQIPRLACLAIHTKRGKKQLMTKLMPGLTKCDLHFFCEHPHGDPHGYHEVVGQPGYRVHFGTKDTKRVISMVKRGLQIATVVTKCVAHVVGGMGSSIPNLAHGASLILDTPGLLDHQLPSTSSIHILSENLGESQAISDEDMKDAERWLINEVSKISDIHAHFKLNKVKYNRRYIGDEMKTRLIAWVCDKHKDDGVSDGSLEPLSYP